MIMDRAPARWRVQENHRDTARWLVRRGSPLKPALGAEVKKGSRYFAKWVYPDIVQFHCGHLVQMSGQGFQVALNGGPAVDRLLLLLGNID
jgi:hypothetical protein